MFIDNKMRNTHKIQNSLTLAKCTVVPRVTGARIAVNDISAVSIVKARNAVAFIHISCKTVGDIAMMLLIQLQVH